jgi:hypothetical protein
MPPDRPFADGDFVVPEDASALDADRLTWLAEERARRRRERFGRRALTRHGERVGVSGSIVVACLAAVVLVGTLVVVVAPSGTRPQLVSQVSPRALADVPPIEVPPARTGSPAAGAPSLEVSTGAMVGRRLPETVLESDAGRVGSTELRPAVVLLVPATCGCVASVAALYRQAEEFRLPVWLVSAGESARGRAQLVRLDPDGTRRSVRWAEDPGSILQRSLRARGLTVVLVASDGVVASVVRNIPAAGRGIPALELVLALLASPPE